MKFMCKGRNLELIKGCSAYYIEGETKIGRPMIEKSNKDVFYYIHLRKLGEFSFDKFDFMEKYYSEREKNLVG